MALRVAGVTLSVVCWLWSTPGYRSTFTPDHVNRLAAMVAWHYPRPHRFLCVADSPAGLGSNVEHVQAWNDFADLKSPHGAGNPACFRRLRAFHPDIARHFGERFVSVDLDWVAVGDLVPLWDRPEDFVMYRDALWPKQYNGSMFLLRAGARRQVWDDFRPATSPAIAAAAGFKGSDQGWISYKLPGEPTWGPADGVYSWRFDMKGAGDPPSGARVVVMHGRDDPWGPVAQRLPWVREHWGTV